MSTGAGKEAGPPSKAARETCYQARDAFYACVREAGVFEYSSEAPIPSKCKKLRAVFEKGCLSSWVKHFDAQQEAQARRAKYLHATINERATTAAGSLSGKTQH